MSSNGPAPGERALIFTLAAIQFINVLEFMIVMPLGPDFASDIGIARSELGVIGGAYTASAAVAGIAASTFIERFDRRKAIAVAMTGLIVATLLAAVATNLPMMIFARVLAGLFGGPASALSLAVVADTVPVERRGKAMGAIMGSFSVASILGIPIALRLASMGTWRWPFYGVAALGVVVVGVALWKLPPLRKHLEAAAAAPRRAASFGELLANPLARLSFLMTTTVMMGSFMLIPNIAAYLQGNLGYPREHLDRLYLVGGVFSFASMRLFGILTDRYGPVRVGTLGTVLLLVVQYLGFVDATHIPVMAMFVGFMVASSSRNVPYNALTSQVPGPHERARFMSIQSSVQHVSAAFGAISASWLLSEGPNGSLLGIERVAWIAIAISALLPPMLWVVQRGVTARRAAVATAAAPTG